MSDGINEPIAPETLDPNPFSRLAGNWQDDDGQALDDLFVAPYLGPVESEGVAHAKESTPEVTRILTSVATLGSPDAGVTYTDPVMLLPADPNRKALRISIPYQANARFELRLGSQKTDVYSRAAIGLNADMLTVGPVNLDGHTGALWAYIATGTLQTSVTALAITS